MGVAYPNTDPASCTWARRSWAQPVWPTYLINWRGAAQFISLINLARRGADMVSSIVGAVRRGVARNIPGGRQTITMLCGSVAEVMQDWPLVRVSRFQKSGWPSQLAESLHSPSTATHR